MPYPLAMQSDWFRRWFAKSTDAATETKISAAAVPEHEPEYSHVAVHFTLTAQLSGHVDVRRSARKLLDSRLATTAAWPSEDSIRLSRHARGQARDLRRTRALSKNYEVALAEGTWRAGLRLVRHHPKIGFMHLRALWAKRAGVDLQRMLDKETPAALVGFILRHPIVGLFRVLPQVRFARDTEEPRATSVRDPADSPDPPSPDEVSDEDSDLAEILDEAERTILDQQIVSAAERFIDRRMFGGSDHDNDRFVRLQLRNSYHDFVLPGGTESQHVVFEPRVLIHESGVLQLDLVIRAEGPLTTAQVLGLMWGPAPRIIRSEMSTPLVRGTDWESRESGFAEEPDMGKPLGYFDHALPVSMTEVARIHLQAILAVLRRVSTDWINYPVALIEAGDCCADGETWQRTHRNDLHMLVIRGNAATTAPSYLEMPRDLSLRSKSSLFATLGSAVYFQWEGESPRGIEELDTVLVFDYALLLYMRLQVLERSVSRMSLRERALTMQYRQALVLFGDLRYRNLRHGETRDVVKHVLDDLGAGSMRATIESALNLSSMAHATRSASRASRRAWWITVLATVITAFVALPTMLEVIDAASLADDNVFFAPVAGVLDWTRGLGFWGPWALIILVLALIAALMSISWVWRHRPQHLPSFRRGFAWPVPITLSEADSDFDFTALTRPDEGTLSSHLKTNLEEEGPVIEADRWKR
jgi:hypothetical protein